MITALYHITHSISGGVHKTVNPTYGCNHRSDCFQYNVIYCVVGGPVTVIVFF